MKTLPILTTEERSFVQEVLAGSTPFLAWCRAHDVEPEGGRASQRISGKASSLVQSYRVREWLEHLRAATPEEMIERVYVEQLTFGETEDAMKAARAYLESQFAGKAIQQVFLETLAQLQPELVIPCAQQAHPAPRAGSARG